jgi:hypothetical protein
MNSGNESGFDIFPMVNASSTSTTSSLGKASRTYDVTFSDGLMRAVLTLHHDFTPLVESGVFKSGSRILVIRATPMSTKLSKPQKLTSSSTYIEGFGVLIQELRLLDNDPKMLPLEQLRVLPWAPGAVSDLRPQFTGRAHYLHIASDDLTVAIPSWKKYAQGELHGLKDGKLPVRKLQLITKFPESNNDMLDLHHLTDESISKEEAFLYPPDIPSLKEVLNMSTQTGRRRSPWPSTSQVLQSGQQQHEMEPWTQHVISREDIAEANRLKINVIRYVRNCAVLSLSNLTNWNGKIPLLGRISAIGRAEHYGTFGMRTEVYIPFKFEFWIINEGMQLRVVCWGSAAIKFCSAVKAAGIGAIVGITGYKVKLDQVGSLEVSLNNHDDESTISEIDHQSIIIALQKRKNFQDLKTSPNFLQDSPEVILNKMRIMNIFPEPKLDIETSKSIYLNKKSGEGCSICGLVSRVGPLQRSINFDNDYLRNNVSTRSLLASIEGADFLDATSGSGNIGLFDRTLGPMSSSGQYSRIRTELGNSQQLSPGFGNSIMHSYRWIWLRDEHSKADICVKAYSNSNIEIAGKSPLTQFEQVIRPGTIAFFTHLRVCSTDKPGKLEGDKPTNPPLYLVSTDLTSAYFDKTNDQEVNKRGFKTLQWFLQRNIENASSEEDKSIILSKNTFAMLYTWHSRNADKFEKSSHDLSFRPKMFRRLGASEPWSARSSFSRPDTLNDLIFLLNSGIQTGGPGVPRLEPSDVDLLRKSNLDVAKVILQANSQSSLGPSFPLSSSSMVGFVDKSTGRGSSSLSTIALTKGLVHLHALESITVVVYGRVARIRGTKPDSDPKKKLAPLPSRSKQSVAPSKASKPVSKKRSAETAAIEDDADAESEEWDGTDLSPTQQTSLSIPGPLLSQETEIRFKTQTRKQAKLSADAKKLKARLRELSNRIESNRLSRRIKSMSEAELKTPVIISLKKDMTELESVKTQLKRLRREGLIEYSDDDEDDEQSQAPPSKKVMTSSSSSSSSSAALKTSAKTVQPPPIQSLPQGTTASGAIAARVASSSAVILARPSARSFKLGEPDVDIKQINQELHEIPNQVEDETWVHGIVPLSDALKLETSVIKSKDERALKIQQLKSKMEEEEDDETNGAHIARKESLARLEKEKKLDYAGEKEFGFYAQHKLPFPLHVLTIAGAGHGIDGKENSLDVLLHPSALLPHMPQLKRPQEDFCVSTEALRDFFPPNAPSSTDASSLKEFEAWAAKKPTQLTSSSSATDSVTWDTSKKYVFVLEITNRSLDFEPSNSIGISVSVEKSGGASSSAASSSLKPLLSTRTRKATVRVVAIYDA